VQRDYVLRSFQRPVDLRIDYAAELNDQQLAAVTASPGPSLVLAGAGSGKTRTLTYRVAYLLEQQVPAERILLLTFTNKAAKEMMRRVSDLVGAELNALWGGTFHSIGARILRANAQVLGYRPDFTILDREDSETMLKTCLGDLKEEGTSVMLPKVEVIADLLSRAANERQSITRTVGQRQETWAKVAPILERLAESYASRKRAANVMDFDDLLVLWLRLLEQHPEARERYQRRFQWVLVDEYQDTNQIQSDLIDLLAAEHHNVMAVGDDSQSIYSWRGANFRNILDFPKRYANARLFKVEVNYRSTPEILAVANAAIAANTEQFAKSLTPARRAGMKPAFVPCEDGHQQAGFVAQRIMELHEEGIQLPEIAVLYRSHFHALELQLELTRRGIPFVITSGIRFFEQAHIKDVTAWLKWVVNPDDELSFKRLTQLLPGVGPKAADKLWTAFGDVYRQRAGTTDGPPVALAPLLIAIRDKAPKKTAGAWANFATTLSQVEDPQVSQRGGAMIQTVVDGFYEEYAGATFPNAEARLDDLEQLANYAGQFQSLTDFLTQLSLLNNMEAEAEQKDSARDDDRVRLSTVHQAKGLEFQVVFVIMLADGLFPSGRSLESPSASEEERRLFYVAVTRAKDELYLCCPLMRSTPGMGLSMLQRSRFLSEIPEKLLDILNLRPANRWGNPPEAPGESSSDDQGDTPF
jgi:DNA helicase-2/ATP-dependent DNA helicase PcrA